MPTGLYTLWDIDSETSRFTLRQNRTCSFENMVMSYFQRTRPDCKNEIFYTTGREEEIDRFSVDGFVLDAILCLRQWLAFNTFVPVKSCVHLSLKEISNVAVRKKHSINRDGAIYKRKVSLSLKCENVSGIYFARQQLMVNFISEKVSLIDDHLQNTNS